jgi:hypothetical protein
MYAEAVRIVIFAVQHLLFSLLISWHAFSKKKLSAIGVSLLDL